MAIIPLTDTELDARLYQLPVELSKEAEISITLRYAYAQLEAEYDNEIDKAYLVAKANNQSMTVKELETKARVDNYELHLKVIQAEAIYKKQENRVELIKNKFDACRSSVKLRCAQIGAGG